MVTFWINAMGEYGRGSSLLSPSMHVINFQKEFHREFGYCPRRRDEQQWFMNQAKQILTGVEYGVYEKFDDVANAIGEDGLFRLYAGVRENGPFLHLVTEFYIFVDDDGTHQKRVLDYAERWGGNSECIDSGIEQEEMTSVATGKTTHGPNHGRPFEHWEVSIPVWEKSIEEIRILKMRMELDAIDTGLGHLWNVVI